jgi:hypothetical protein
MPTRTQPILAKAIETTDKELVIITAQGRFRIPWELCSEKLAQASIVERKYAQLPPSGYGVPWPLIDEDLAVGPLLRSIDPQAA